MKNILKNMLIFSIAAVLLLSNVFSVQAETDEVIKADILHAAELLKESIEADFKETENRLKWYIRRGNYDYTLSMESYYEQKNPMLDMDLAQVMATYAVAKKEMAVRGIDDLHFFKVKGVPGKEINVCPEKIELYEKLSETNFYRRAGDTYTIENITVPAFRRIEGGNFEKIGTKKITPKKVEVNIFFGRIELKSSEQLLEELNLKGEKYLQEVTRRKQILDRILSGRGLSQGIFIKLPQNMPALVIKDCSENRKQFLESAISLIGQVPYYWGGKPAHAGYDNTWWTINENGEQKGLDCSGFVEWALLDSGYPESIWKNMMSTAQIIKNTTIIDEKELQPGDLGLLHSGPGINHVGIYAGNGVFIHCSSAAGTVVAQKYDGFKIFCRIPEMDSAALVEKKTSEGKEYLLSRDDMELLAKAVSHEAKGEGINGWIGVTQVILNRKDSELFPNSIYDILYAENQFENNEDIEKEEPTDQLRQTVEMVCAGKLSVFDRKDIFYFRNNTVYGSSNWNGHTFVKSINRHGFYSQN